MMKISLLTILLITGVFAQELEVEGSLKVSGEIDASNQKITNVADPTLSTDAATAYYVDERTAGKGRIITLKCPWHITGNSYATTPIDGSCEPLSCPEGWNELAIFNEVTSGFHTSSGDYVHVLGNSVHYCIEEEE